MTVVESVDKKELEAIVREMYGQYGKEIYDIDLPHICRGWWQHFEHDDANELRTTLKHLTVVERFMPPAGTIKMAHLRRLCTDPPPTEQEFWSLVQTLTHQRNSGTTHLPQKTPTKTPEKNNPPKSGPTKTPHKKTPPLQHPAIQNTLQELGPALYTLTTNQDRNFALEAYNRHTLNFLQGQNS